jgi:hypothetical protein
MSGYQPTLQPLKEKFPIINNYANEKDYNNMFNSILSCFDK